MENGSWLSKDEIQIARDSSQTLRCPGLREKSRNAGYLSVGTQGWEGTLGTASQGCEAHREHGQVSGMGRGAGRTGCVFCTLAHVV